MRDRLTEREGFDRLLQLRRIFVVKLGWVDEQTFVDLFALGNALPGQSHDLPSLAHPERTHPAA